MQLKYRYDIDGLRTIAVFLVILHHAGFTFFPGGFIGVDVFFVISGFLITSIISSAIENNTFSFLSFLSRRIKRLMPVLFFVIFVCVLVFSFVLLPHDLTAFFESIIWVVFDVGNFYFWLENGGYFAGNSQEVPLLHTWSLAVEEQYYLLWPLMLVLSFRYLGAKVTLYIAVLGSVAATIFSQWGTNVTIGAAYYLLPTRFFELLIGSTLALSWQKLPNLNVWQKNIFSALGLSLMIGSAVFLSEHSAFPGYNALYPVLGAVFIIYASSSLINSFLSLKPIVFTGKISYSLYLWHWPIFVFARYTSVELNLVNQVLCILLAYVLAVLSWYFIEQPMRTVKLSSFKQIVKKMYIYPASVLIAISIVGIYSQGFQGRYPQSVLNMDSAVNTFSNESRKLCHSSLRNSGREPSKHCFFGKTPEKTDADLFVFGDSHANHLIPFVSVLASAAGLTGQDYTLDQCPPIFGINWGGNLYKAKKCKQRNDRVMQQISDGHFKYVVLAASWPGNTHRLHVDQAGWGIKEKDAFLMEQISKTVQFILEAEIIPVIIADTPSLGGKNPKCPIKQAVFNDELDCRITGLPNNNMQKIYALLSKRFPKLVILEPRELFCKGNSCDMSLNGTPLYRDDDHLNEVGSKLLGNLYLKTNKNPFVLEE